MSQRLHHSLLTLLFVLLQCVSPLVHAHADGEQSGLLHLPAAWSVAQDGMDGWSADEDIIINLSDDLHRYAQCALPPAALSPLPVPLRIVQAYRLPSLSVTRFQRAACCTPPPQAPPVLS